MKKKMIYPIFASDGSIGKSLLTVKPPEEISTQKSISIFSIAKEYDLDQIFICDDSFCNFIQAYEQAEALDKQLIFGIKFQVCDDIEVKEKDRNDREKGLSTVRVWIKESYDFDKGYEDLIKMYSESYKEENYYYHNRLDWNILNELYTDNLMVTIDFYNSFLQRNTFQSGTTLAKFDSFQPVMESSQCGLPFDHLMKKMLDKYCKINKCPVIETHPIYYYDKASIKTFQVSKMIHRRGFGGRPPSIDMPQLDHFSSDAFCFEGYCDRAGIEFKRDEF